MKNTSLSSSLAFPALSLSPSFPRRWFRLRFPTPSNPPLWKDPHASCCGEISDVISSLIHSFSLNSVTDLYIILAPRDFDICTVLYRTVNPCVFYSLRNKQVLCPECVVNVTVWLGILNVCRQHCRSQWFQFSWYCLCLFVCIHTTLNNDIALQCSQRSMFLISGRKHFLRFLICFCRILLDLFFMYCLQGTCGHCQ